MTRKAWFRILTGVAAAVGFAWAGNLHAACPDATTLCLNNNRFAVTATFATSQGQLGTGQAVPLTSDTGYFWFFSANNVELVVKVVDGRVVNSSFWVFAGGLTNVVVVMRVTDTVTLKSRTYLNPQGTAFQPIQDTTAFSARAGDTSGNVPVGEFIAGLTPERPGLAGPPDLPPQAESAEAACIVDATTLCLNAGRFKVKTQWTTPQGQTGAGQGVGLTGDTGYFWFFSSTNVEMVVKVLDACSLNSRVWVFAGGLTNVNVVMTVTDTQTGSVKTYTNPQVTAFQPIQDTGAFASCGVANPCAPPNRCLGPAPRAFPALIDTNGDNRPTPGVDMELVPVFDTVGNADGKQIYVDTPWDICGHPRIRQTLILSDFQAGTGIPTTAHGIMNNTGDLIQIAATDFTASNEPTKATMKFSLRGVPVAEGNGSLLDPGGLGYFNTIRGTRTVGLPLGSSTMQLVYYDVNGDGIPDYVSLPWFQMTVAGVQFKNGCGPGGTTPQIFFPLANRRIIMDLDGNGLPDTGVFQSPMIAPATITPGSLNASKKAPAGAALGLILIAWLKLRRGRRGLRAGPEG